MNLLPSRYRKISHGQALVEFALILPILAMLLVMALDLGRVYFGWVGLQNAARIGANYAAIHPDAWSAPDNPLKVQARAQYAQQIAQDASALNCSPVPSTSNVPAPVFINIVGSANTREMGDHASVTLTCAFQLITPFANSFFSGGVPIGANAVFTIRAGTIAGIPVAPVIPTPTPSGAPVATPAPCQAPVANFSGTPTSGKGPLKVTFTNASIEQGCPIISYAWTFGDGTTSTVENPTHVYAKRGQPYSVTLQVSSAAGASPPKVLGGYIHAT